MSRPPNLCVYCGKPGITKEHIRGAWSAKYGRRFERTAHTVSIPSVFNHNIQMNVKKGAADRPGGPRSLTLKIACKACNEGWMKAIQDEARPILKLMMHGYWGTPDNKELISLVRWIILFNMSYEFIDRKTVCIDFEERDRFRKTLEPSDDWQIAIGYADTIAWDDRAFHRALDTVTPRLEGNNKSQFTAFLFWKASCYVTLCCLSITNKFPVDF